ncbi:MAG: protein kinase [Actinomycetota bacterium]|nr:protein kinase [Actinomycetota bacterium]
MSSVLESGSGSVIAGRYELGKVLGRGGMGEVRAARDLKLERPVAIKLLRPEMAVRPDFKERFAGEARAAGRLMHPNIVAVYDTGEHDGMSYIVMELLPGRTLADVLAAEGPFDSEAARRVALEVLSALDASHREGVLHRDIKPGNLLLTRDGSVKVADFGVAKIAEGLDMTMTGLLLGTPAYLAPELVDGAPATTRSDIYSVGIVLYELLAGRRPFEAETPLALAMSIKRDDPPPLMELRPDLDPQLVAIVEKAMAKNPRDRYADARQMMKALEGSPSPIEAVDTILPATDRTQPMPVATGSTRAATRVMGQATRVQESFPAEPRAPGWGLGGRTWAAAAVAILVILSLLVFANMRGGEPPPPAPTPTADADGAQLAPALDGAIDRLEEAVRP